jgi:hypothetical protein
MINRPFLELGRIFLLRDLFRLLPPKSNVNCTSPLEDYLSGEPQNGFNVAAQGWFVYCNGIKDKSVFNNRLDFTVSMLPYVGNDNWVDPALHAIKECLDSDVIPVAAEECEYCQYAVKYAAASNQ